MKSAINFLRNTPNNLSFFVVFAFVFAMLAANVNALNIFDYLYATEAPSSVVQSNITVGSTVYTVITISGKDSMVLKGDAIVKTESEIELALKAQCFSASYPSAAELNTINSDVLAFNSSRESGTPFGTREAYCDQIVGQAAGDEGGCNDLISCQISCNQGSYACFQYAQGSAMFLPELLNYANNKRSINGNLSIILATTAELKGVQNTAQLNFEVVERMSRISTAISAISSEAIKYANNRLWTRPSFEFCIPYGQTFSFNDSALVSANTTTTILASRASCFDSLPVKAKNALNETLKRVDYYTNTFAKGTIQDQFDTLITKYNALTQSASDVTLILDDKNIPTYMTDVESLSAQFYGNIRKNLVDQAGLTVSQLDTKLGEFENYLDSTYLVFGALLTNKSNATYLLSKANLIIEASDGALSADLDKLEKRAVVLETKLSSKINAEEVTSYAASYEAIVNETQALINKKKSLESERVPNMLSGAMQGISLAVLNSVAGPFGVKEVEKRAWITNVPMIVIVLLDIVLLAVASILFFFVVWRNTSKMLQPKVIQTWGIIGIVFLLLLGGLSFALNSALSAEMGAASVYSFASALKSKDSVILFTEHKSTDNTVALNDCAATIDRKLSTAGKTVTRVEVIDGICSDKLLTECLSQTGVTPIVRMRYADKNTTAFYTFYKTEAVVEGDKAYFTNCLIGDVMD